MATSELMSVREYLSTPYRPDRDYVDGVVLEQNVGEGGTRDCRWRSAHTYINGGRNGALTFTLNKGCRFPRPDSAYPRFV